MSTYVYMRILESAPERYDRGIRLLSLGGVDAMYDAVADSATAGRGGPPPRILEIGCGTGNLTRALVARGASVVAIDQNPEMLALAREKLAHEDAVELCELTAVEVADRFPADSFDAVASSLALSEMTDDEQAYVLAAARRVIRPGGRLVVADEVRPDGLLARVWHALLRWPVALVTYVLTQTGTRAVRDLPAKIQAAGFELIEVRPLPRSGTTMVVGRRPVEAVRR